MYVNAAFWRGSHVFILRLQNAHYNGVMVYCQGSAVLPQILEILYAYCGFKELKIIDTFT